MRRLQKVVLAVLAVLTVSLSAPAHHGYAAYDNAKTLSLKGTIVDYQLANPHSTISFDVKDESGKTQRWSVEFGYVRTLKEQGWTTDTLKPGDQVMVTLHPAKNGTPVGSMSKITYADGSPLPLRPERSAE